MIDIKIVAFSCYKVIAITNGISKNDSYEEQYNNINKANKLILNYI